MRAEYEAMKLVPRVTLSEMFTSAAMRMPLIIACVIMLAQVSPQTFSSSLLPLPST